MVTHLAERQSFYDADEEEYGGLTRQDVVDAVTRLRALNAASLPSKSRIRNIMDGGEAGIKALLGDKIKGIGPDIPAPNLMHSGMERLAQKLGQAPILRADPPSRTKNEEAARESAEKRERIVEHYDYVCQLELQLPQAARWLIGYAYCAWTFRSLIDVNGHRYPEAVLRDPWETWPGEWGDRQQPVEVAFVKLVSPERLARLYPDYKDVILKTGPFGRKNKDASREWSSSAFAGNQTSGQTWEAQGGGGLELVEYMNRDGTWLYLPQLDLMVDYYPNPLKSGPAFYIMKRISFNKLIGQYHHVIGLMAQLAKQNVMELIAMEDATFVETNIIGDIGSRTYKRGRGKNNWFPAGTKVERPQSPTNPMIFQAIDRTERHLRQGANYTVADDGRSATAFATGAGNRELQNASGLNVQEYQTVLKWGLQRIDAIRLEWDETLYPTGNKPLVSVKDGAPHQENYTPKTHIKGNYLTLRVYGIMAGLDDASKIVAILQLLQARLIDRRSAMDQLRGMDDVPKILRNIIEDEAELNLMQILAQMAVDSVNDPEGATKARMALIEMNIDPGNKKDILRKFFTPNDPALSDEERAFSEPLPEAPQIPGQAPPVSTVLARLEQNGEVSGGVQSVGRLT